MKVLRIHRLHVDKKFAPSMWRSKLDSMKSSAKIDVLSWPEFPYRPRVRLKAAYGPKHLFLKYDVEEKYIRALKVRSNQPVCKDSCVEFFVSGREGYYNFEFNCIGTCLAAFGKDRYHRRKLSPVQIKTIERISTLGNKPFRQRQGNFSWSISVAIPFLLFIGQVPRIKGMSVRANFYKCGDHLRKPHYLAWNRGSTPKPDFHQPSFFGTLVFV